MNEHARYRAVSRPYAKRFPYVYRRHVFDKLRVIDLTLAEFQVLLGQGEVIGEIEIGLGQTQELVLLVEWLHPLHVVVAVDLARREERLVTVYEPDPRQWSDNRWRRR